MAIHYSKQIFKSGKAHTKYSQTAGEQTIWSIVVLFQYFLNCKSFVYFAHGLWWYRWTQQSFYYYYYFYFLFKYGGMVIIHFRWIQFEFRRWKIAMIQYRLCQVRNVMCYLKLRNDFPLNDFGRNVFDKINLSSSHGRVVTICFRVEWIKKWTNCNTLYGFAIIDNEKANKLLWLYLFHFFAYKVHPMYVNEYEKLFYA